MTKIRTLQEIQDEIATDKFRWHSGWDQLSVEHKNDLWPEVCRRAQYESSKASLEKAYSKSTINGDRTIEINVTNRCSISLAVDKESITDPSNIIILK